MPDQGMAKVQTIVNQQLAEATQAAAKAALSINNPHCQRQRGRFSYKNLAIETKPLTILIIPHRLRWA